jgi:hypothetical protein
MVDCANEKKSTGLVEKERQMIRENKEPTPKGTKDTSLTAKDPRDVQDPF